MHIGVYERLYLQSAYAVGYCCYWKCKHTLPPQNRLDKLLCNVIIICIWKRHGCCVLQLLLILLLLLLVNLHLRWCKSNLLYKVQVGVPAIQDGLSS